MEFFLSVYIFLHSFRKLGVSVYNERKVLKTYNVIGIIKGLTEPGMFNLKKKFF